jgi:hypothetical protein
VWRDKPGCKDKITRKEALVLIGVVLLTLWDSIDEELCGKYCNNYHRRLLEVKKNKGGQTKY